MLHNPALEASFVTTYVDDYLDLVESLPNRIQPFVSKIKQLDLDYRCILNQLNLAKGSLAHCKSGKERKNCIVRIEHLIRQGQLIGDAKLKHVEKISGVIEQKRDQLDHDVNSFGVAPSADDLQSNAESTGRPVRTNAVYGKTIARYRARALSINTVKVAKQDNGNLSTPESRPTPPKVTTVHKQRTSPYVRAARKLAGKQPRMARALNANKLNRASPTTSTLTAVKNDDERKGSRSPTPRSSSRTTNNPLSNTTTSRKKVAQVVEKDKPTRGGKRRAAPANATASGSKSPRNQQLNVEVDIDEVRYCICNQPSFGDMVGCDNDNCEVEWFHFICVSLTATPKGKWYCPNCRGDKYNSLKPSLAK